MAIYRTIHMSFWTDADVLDNFTPEDRYFYLYLMTNPHTNLAGCYEISVKNIAIETGYSAETVDKLLLRMERDHRKIIYDRQTKELLIVNWGKHNWNASPKFQKPLCNEIDNVKNDSFREYLIQLQSGSDTVSIPYQYGSDTTVTVTDTVTVNKTKGKRKKKKVVEDPVCTEIILYLNEKSGKRFKTDTEDYIRAIHGRMSEGYTVDDFKRVIDIKSEQWKDDAWGRKYLQPSTLFCKKHFDEYLNQAPLPQKKDAMEEWMNDRNRV